MEHTNEQQPVIRKCHTHHLIQTTRITLQRHPIATLHKRKKPRKAENNETPTQRYEQQSGVSPLISLLCTGHVSKELINHYNTHRVVVNNISLAP
ncbi:hypothetical protein HC762_00425 [bacterium]|nr:hypothetical protein [bacterium]